MPQTPADTDADVMDLRGLKCPLPALMSRRALKDKPPGTQMTVVADDPMAFIDVPHMCREEGHEVIRIDRDGDVSRMLLRRGA